MKTFSAWLFGLSALLCCSYGEDVLCDIQNGGGSCSSPLGGSLVIKVLGENMTVQRWDLKKGTKRILSWQETWIQNTDKSKYLYNKHSKRLTITSLNRDDPDDYRFETYEDGRLKLNVPFRIHVQAPVSNVTLTHQCLANGAWNVSCRAKGDALSFHWLLEGNNLTSSQLQSGSSEENSISLKEGVSGWLQCIVRNNLNSDAADVLIPKCGLSPNDTGMIPGPKNETNNDISGSEDSTTTETWPVLVGVLVALVLLLAIVGAVAYIYRKKRKAPVDTQELTYADVNVENHRGKRQRKEPEEMVAYSEVRIPRQQRDTEESMAYSEVRFAQQPPRTVRQKEESIVYSTVQQVL